MNLPHVSLNVCLRLYSTYSTPPRTHPAILPAKNPHFPSKNGRRNTLYRINDIVETLLYYYDDLISLYQALQRTEVVSEHYQAKTARFVIANNWQPLITLIVADHTPKSQQQDSSIGLGLFRQSRRQ